MIFKSREGSLNYDSKPYRIRVPNSTYLIAMIGRLKSSVKSNVFLHYNLLLFDHWDLSMAPWNFFMRACVISATS